ncbi:MFS transporter [Alicyclobacillus acidiphilus]|uniref:MFS transporter n=1 Tax=Alicyclobacillus acidiphilus TaxID=182455 RepID=UPI000A54BCCE|nr:MFS transporter [Alicyclobacillus acidiphilus]
MIEDQQAVPARTSWKTILWIMAAVQFCMSIAFSSSNPFMALYVEQLGVHNVRHVELLTGIVQGMTPLMAALMSPFWGTLSDRSGRKMMVLRSTIAIAIFTGILGLAQNTWELIVIRALQGSFSGFSAASIALVASVIPQERLGFSLGWIQTSSMIGTLVGPLLGGVAADYTHNYHMVFFLTTIFAFIAFSITLVFVKEPQGPRVNTKKKPSLIGQFKAIRRLKTVQSMFVVLFLTQFTVMSVQPVLSVFMKQLAGNVSYLNTIAGFAFAVTGLADLIASPFLGKRSDTIGYRRVLIICMTGAGLFYLPQALSPNIWVFVASRFGLGMFIGGILPTANALIGRMTPSDQRGQIYGFTSSATFLGSFAGPLLGGVGSAFMGIRWMLGVAGALYICNMLWVVFKVREPSHFADET